MIVRVRQCLPKLVEAMQNSLECVEILEESLMETLHSGNHRELLHLMLEDNPLRHIGAPVLGVGSIYAHNNVPVTVVLVGPQSHPLGNLSQNIVGTLEGELVWLRWVFSTCASMAYQ